MISLNLAGNAPAAPRPTRVKITPLPLTSIFDHHLRRSHDQDRVLGTLLGVYHEDTQTVEILDAFGVPFEDNGSSIQLDTVHHRALLDLHSKIASEIVVGWYTTAPALNSFTSPIHQFYNSESPYPAVHLAVDPDTLDIQAYLASPLSLSGKPDQYAFVPVPTSLIVNKADEAAIELLSKPGVQFLQTTSDLPDTTQQPVDSLQNLDDLLTKVEQMLDVTTAYTQNVVEGKIKGDEKVGRELAEALAKVPIVSENDAEEGGFDGAFNKHLSDVLMVSYLSNLITAQVEISERLNLLV